MTRKQKITQSIDKSKQDKQTIQSQGNDKKPEENTRQGNARQ
jgi:hypothetical protein